MANGVATGAGTASTDGAMIAAAITGSVGAAGESYWTGSAAT